MKKLKKYLNIFWTSVQNHFAYFYNFLLGTGFFIFILFVLTQLWKAIYAENTVIEGFSLKMVIWYLIITETIILSRSNFHQEINEKIKSGEMAYLLLRPYNLINYYLFNSLGEILPKLGAHFLVGLPLGYLLTGTVELDGLFPVVLISVFLGCIINFALYMVLALTAFWTEDNTAFFFIYSKLIFFIGGMMIPIDFLPDWLQNISKVLPFVFVTYWPARLAVSFNWPTFYRITLLQIIYLVFIMVIGNLIYQKGVKKINVNGG